MALSDLKTNPKISSLLAYFVNFVASGVSRTNFDQLIFFFWLEISCSVNNFLITIKQSYSASLFGHNKIFLVERRGQSDCPKCRDHQVKLYSLFQVKTYSHDLTQLSKLLGMVRSLIDNPSLFLEPYVSKKVLITSRFFLSFLSIYYECKYTFCLL